MEISSVTGFIDYYENVRSRTMRIIRCIPPAKIDWTYWEGKWTLADLVRHLGAIERYMWAENVQGRPSRYPGHGAELADGYEAVVGYIEKVHGESMEIFRSLGDDDLKKKCITPAGNPITIWKWLRAMIEHEIHHRGQFYTYLGGLGIETPPLFGLTSEDVRERSRP